MHSPTLEQDLQAYALNNDNTLFNDKLAMPITYFHKWIMNKQYNNCLQSNRDDVLQCVLIRITKGMRYYKTGKGNTAISFMRRLIKQEISLQKKRYDTQDANRATLIENTSGTTTAKDNSYEQTKQQAIAILTDYARDNAALSLSQRKIIKAMVKLLETKPIAWLNAKRYRKVKMIQRIYPKATVSVIRDTMDTITTAGLLH